MRSSKLAETAVRWQRADRRGPQRRRQRTGPGSRGDRSTSPSNYEAREPARPRSPRRSPSRPKAARPSGANTQAQREHERYIDKVLDSNDSGSWTEEPRDIDRERDADAAPSRATRDSHPRPLHRTGHPGSPRPPASLEPEHESQHQPAHVEPLNPRSSKQGTMAATPTSSRPSRKHGTARSPGSEASTPTATTTAGLGSSRSLANNVPTSRDLQDPTTRLHPGSAWRQPAWAVHTFH